jgi:hypothetical protein
MTFGPVEGGDVSGGNIVVRLILDAREYIEGLGTARDASADVANWTREQFSQAFQGASQEVKLFGRLLQTDMQQNRTSLEQAFRSLRDGTGQLQVGKEAVGDMTEAFQRMGGTIRQTGFSLSNFIKGAYSQHSWFIAKSVQSCHKFCS